LSGARFWNFRLVPGVNKQGKILLEVALHTMVIIAVFGGLVAGGALFAILKSSGSKSSADKYTKLDIG